MIYLKFQLTATEKKETLIENLKKRKKNENLKPQRS